MINVKALLKSQGASFKNVVRAQLFLVDINDFATVDKAYKEFFEVGFPFPARTAVAVHQLPKGAKFEIQVDVIVDN